MTETSSEAALSAQAERRPSTESLRGKGVSSAHFLRLVEEQGSIGFWSAELANDQITATAGLRRVFGVPDTEALTLTRFLHLCHPDDLHTLADWPAVLRDGQAVDREYRIVRSDGVARWIRNKAEVVLDHAGRPSRAMGVVTDVTARQDARHMAQVGHGRYQALVRAIAVVVWSATADGATRGGEDWQRLTGGAAEDLAGYGWLNFIHPEDRSRSRETWRLAVMHQSLFETDYRILCADGIYRWFNARGAPILNQDGSIHEWIGVCLSITGSQRFQSDHDGRSTIGRMTAGQSRAARALLGWSAERLAEASGLSLATIARVEDEVRSGKVRASNIGEVKEVLEAAGVVFYSSSDGKTGIYIA